MVEVGELPGLALDVIAHRHRAGGEHQLGVLLGVGGHGAHGDPRVGHDSRGAPGVALVARERVGGGRDDVQLAAPHEAGGDL